MFVLPAADLELTFFNPLNESKNTCHVLLFVKNNIFPNLFATCLTFIATFMLLLQGFFLGGRGGGMGLYINLHPTTLTKLLVCIAQLSFNLNLN